MVIGGWQLVPGNWLFSTYSWPLALRGRQLAAGKTLQKADCHIQIRANIKFRFVKISTQASSR